MSVRTPDPTAMAIEPGNHPHRKLTNLPSSFAILFLKLTALAQIFCGCVRRAKPNKGLFAYLVLLMHRISLSDEFENPDLCVKTCWYS